MQYINIYRSPLGTMTLASNGASLTGLWFHGQKYFAGTLDPEHENRDLPIFDEVKRWLDLYFRGKNPDFMPPLSPAGSSFRCAVFQILQTIPYGTVTTYREIAAVLAKQQGLPSMSAQAVGGAVGHNPISILIPCHRVMGANGSLTGYAGGIDKKQKLLELEKVNLEHLLVP